MSLAVLASAVVLASRPALSAAYVYNGIDRPFIVNVDARGKLALQLIDPADSKVLEEGAAKRGKLDLNKVLPSLFKEKRRKVLFAQLTADGKPKGSPLVLQPMTNPPVATLDPTTKNPKWDPDEDDIYAGVRTWSNQNVVLDTSEGEIEVKLRPDVAPNTVYNFVQLVAGGFYRDVIFHRIVQKGRNGGQFVAQGGDPTGTGMGSPGYSIPLEKSALKHDFGIVGMARSTDPNTGSAQFYFGLSREATQHLDGRYTTFAETVRGHDVLKKIANVQIGPKDDRPVNPPLIKLARFVEPK
jgi:cyclophilin family peptidyl-prolyl cis-trans isomerase